MHIFTIIFRGGDKIMFSYKNATSRQVGHSVGTACTGTDYRWYIVGQESAKCTADVSQIILSV